MGDKVRVIGLETEEDKIVHPIDAKELVATGRYKEVRDAKKKEKVQEAEEKVEEPQTIEEMVNNMKSREIIKYTKANDIQIEGLKEMNLKDRRDALIFEVHLF